MFRDIQNVRASGRFTLKWDEGEKTWGYSATKFINRILKNRVMIKISLLFSVFFRENLTSFFREIIIFDRIFEVGLEVFCWVLNNIRGRMIKIIHDVDRIELLGSKIENKLFIIGWFLCLFLRGGFCSWDCRCFL